MMPADLGILLVSIIFANLTDSVSFSVSPNLVSFLFIVIQMVKIFVLVNGSCPDGWKYYNKHCYKHFTSNRMWSEAQFVCAKSGANLVSIHDDKEQDFLIYFYQNLDPIKIWTGLLKIY